MHPLIRAAATSLVFVALGSRAGVGAAHPPGDALVGGGQEPTAVRSDPTAGLSSVCPPGSLPDADVCVPIPADDDVGGEELSAFGGGHHDKRGRFRTYEQIPRRPDRPAEYEVYRYPVATAKNARLTMSGYDLDRPEDEQRRGRKFSHVGHGGIDLAAPRGAEVRVVALDHQEGDAEVLFVGKLFGTTVVTKHTLREGGRLRSYVVLHGHLDRPAAGLERGQPPLAEGSVIGYVGDTGSEGIVHLHLEVRRVRDGIDLAKTPPERLVANEISVVCDPRNVLPLQ
jgi:murein DD-endopeptidase MepM/ murein hydrolase activator NlpD